MNDEVQAEEQSQGMALSDIYFVLFRHKWIILIGCMVGVLGGTTLVFTAPPLFQSETTLLIRYVAAGTPLNLPGNEAATRSLNDQEQSIINNEVQILQSFDLARQVAEEFGPAKILAKVGGGSDTNTAGSFVAKHLTVESPTRGSLIPIIFRHPDPDVTQEVLTKVISVYFKKHAEAHSLVQVSGDSLAEETKRLKDQLAQTETELRRAKSNAGVTTTVDDAKRAYAELIVKNRTDRDNAEADLAQRQAILEGLGKPDSATPGTTNTEEEIPILPEIASDYHEVCVLLDDLLKRKQLYLLSFTEDSIPVKDVRQQIAETINRKRQLEKENPRLVNKTLSSTALPGQPAGPSVDTAAETLQVIAIKARMRKLDMQFSEIQSNAARIDEMETTILDLQRKKELEEGDLKYFSANLQQAKIDAALGTGNAPNIRIIDPPTPPGKARAKSFKKILAMVTLGPILGGLALAFLIELFLDRSVKRPGDVEAKLRLPLFISIPDINRNGSRRLARATGKDPLLLTDTRGEAPDKPAPEASSLMPATTRNRSHPLRRYYEGLRDRLIVNFEVRNLVQKPKLVAVTSCGKGVGVSTIAAGLAASLSETGEGNVLLVGMNAEQGASQEFYKGKARGRVDDARTAETMKNALVQSNVPIADERFDEDKLPRVLPPQFAHLMPKLKASHYDYIVFDMPPVSQTSLTPRMARLMDMVLLVIESERTNQDIVKRATALLGESKVTVSAVLNKTRTYIPAWLHQDFLDEV